MKQPSSITVSQGAVQIRASEVKTQLITIRGHIEDDFFSLCDLLREAQEGDYATVWGYDTFKDWIERGSGLDMSASQAYYLVKVSKTAHLLGLTREQLKAVKVSKLKAIFMLNPDEFAAEIKQLIDEAPGMSLEEVKSRVQSLRGEAETEYYTLKLEKFVKENFEAAIELCRKNYGSVVSNGDPVDISISKCVELIIADYLAGLHNYAEGDAPGQENGEDYE